MLMNFLFVYLTSMKDGTGGVGGGNFFFSAFGFLHSSLLARKFYNPPKSNHIENFQSDNLNRAGPSCCVGGSVDVCKRRMAEESTEKNWLRLKCRRYKR